MPVVRIPLVGTYNTRGVDAENTLSISEDQRFLNCTFNVVQNPVTGKVTVYAERRPGWAVDSIPASGQPSTGLMKPKAFNAVLTAFGGTTSTIYFGTTSVGSISGLAIHFKETLISNVAHVMIKSSDGTAWYYVNGAKDTLTYTADGNNSTTITDIKVSGVNSTSGLYPGQKLTAGSNIPAGTRIVSVNSTAFTAVLDTATTGGAFNDLSITKEPIAKILDSDFVTTGTYISGFEELDGRLYYVTDDGNVRNTDINSVTSFPAAGSLAVQMSPDPAIAIARSKNYLIVFGSASKEIFKNANAGVDAPLLRIAEAFQRMGCLDQKSVTQIEDMIFFVSTPDEGDVGVYMIQDMLAKRISQPNLDRILGSLVTDGTIYANSFRLAGYPYLGLVATTSSSTTDKLLLESGDYLLLETGDKLVLESDPSTSASFHRMFIYNIGLNIWSEWSTNLVTFVDSVGSGTANQILATSRMNTGGKVWTIAPVPNGDVWTDDGSGYICEIRTARIDHGTAKRKVIPKIKLICDKESTGTVSLEASDDDYGSWVTLGSFDLTKMEPTINRCGSHVGGRAYRLRHENSAHFRAEALEIEYVEASG